MTYSELVQVELKAWNAYLQVLEDYGLDKKKVSIELNNADAYNDVFDIVIGCVDLEPEYE
jgi:hypothetical protein